MRQVAASLVLVVFLAAGCSDGNVRAADRETCKASLDVINDARGHAPAAIERAKGIDALVDTIERDDLAAAARNLVAVAGTVGVNSSGAWRSNGDFQVFFGATRDLLRLCERYYPDEVLQRLERRGRP